MVRKLNIDSRRIVLALAALPLAACGGGASPSPSPSVSVSVSVSPTASNPGGSGEPRCDVGQLQLKAGAGNAAAGHVSEAFVLTNTSTGQCFLFGYPGLQMLDASARPIPTKVIRGGGFSFPDQRPARVDLAPGAAASFTADWANATGYPQGCPTSSRLEVTPPDSFHQLVIDASLQPCPDGTIHVSPVVSGARGAAG